MKQSHISGKLLYILSLFLTKRKEAAMVTGQNLSYAQGSVKSIIILNLHKRFIQFFLQCKPFSDNKSIFSVVHDVNTSEKELNIDLKRFKDWAFK